MKHLLVFTILISLYACNFQTNPEVSIETENTFEIKTSKIEADKTAILKVMNDQEIAWSQNDLDGFMEGYHQSDSLKFYGKSGLT
jgi:hypothetical protein